MATVSVAIVNDYPVVVRGLDAMLEPYADRVRVADLAAGEGPARPVDVTLYDTFAAERALHEIVADPRVGRVLLYCWNLGPQEVQEALARGCAGYVDKGASAEELVAAIERAAAGQPTVVHASPAREPAPGELRWPGRELDLSAREAEVLALITRGLTNKDIADRLNLSINTVKTYIRSAYLKIGVSRRSQAVKWGMENGLVPGADREDG